MPSFHLRVATFLGVFPFTDNGRFSFKYAVYSIFALSLLFYEIFAVRNPDFFDENLQTTKIRWLISDLIDIKKKVIAVVTCAHLCKLSLNREAVTDIARSSGPPSDDSPFLLVTAALVVKFAIEWAQYDFNEHLDKMVDSLILSHLNLAMALIVLQFCGMLRNFHHELNLLYSFMKTQQAYNVTAFVDKHAQIVNQMKISNTIYSHQILSGCIFNGDFMVINLLLLVIGILQDHHPLDLAESAFSTIYYFIMLVYLMTLCQRTTEMANEFNVELFQFLKDNNDHCSNDKILLYVKMKQTVEFSACGFFTLGYPLLTSIMTVVSTYLVILLQFSLPK